MDDAAMNVGQSIVAAGMSVGKSFVVEAHQVEDRGVEVVDVDRGFSHVDAVLVRFAVGDAGLHSGTGQP